MGLLGHWLGQDQDRQEEDQVCLRRRSLLCGLAGGAALMAMPDLANATMRSSQKRVLAFSHTHTGEKLAVTYRVGDHYVPDAMAQLARLMRDFRTGDVHPIDPGLFDLLWKVQSNLKTKQHFEIISAFRSSKTNTMLRGRSASTGVAKKSMHLTGQAIDIRLPGIALADVRDAAIELKGGGVGYYPESDFVHIDTGRVRRW